MARSYQTGTLSKRKLKDRSTSYRLTYRQRRSSDGAWEQKVEHLGRFRSQADAKEKAQDFMKGVNARNAGILEITEGSPSRRSLTSTGKLTSIRRTSANPRETVTLLP